MRYPKNILMMCLLLLTCAACASPQVTSPVRVLASGGNGSIKTQAYHDLHTAGDFRTWWQRTYAGYAKAPALPSVDFGNDMVLAVFLGERNHGGYAIHVAGINRTENAYNVSVVITTPGSGCHTTQAMVRPFEFVVVPDNQGLFINWNVTRQVHAC